MPRTNRQQRASSVAPLQCVPISVRHHSASGATADAVSAMPRIRAKSERNAVAEPTHIFRAADAQRSLCAFSSVCPRAGCAHDATSPPSPVYTNGNINAAAFFIASSLHAHKRTCCTALRAGGAMSLHWCANADLPDSGRYYRTVTRKVLRLFGGPRKECGACVCARRCVLTRCASGRRITPPGSIREYPGRQPCHTESSCMPRRWHRHRSPPARVGRKCRSRSVRRDCRAAGCSPCSRSCPKVQ